MGGDANWEGGRIWSLVYFAGEDVADVLRDAYSAAIFTNGLGPGRLQEPEEVRVRGRRDDRGPPRRARGRRQHDLRRHREHPHGREDRPRLRPRREGHHRAGDGRCR